MSVLVLVPVGDVDDEEVDEVRDELVGGGVKDEDGD